MSYILILFIPSASLRLCFNPITNHKMHYLTNQIYKQILLGLQRHDIRPADLEHLPEAIDDIATTIARRLPPDTSLTSKLENTTPEQILEWVSQQVYVQPPPRKWWQRLTHKLVQLARH